MSAFRLFCKFMIISLKKEYEYRFELFMTLLQLVFNVGFTIIFWYTLFQYLPQLEGWTIKELLLYTALVLLGDGLAGVFFGFRDMPERILSGELDKYLVRPMNALICLLFEQVSVFYFLEEAIVSAFIFGFVIWKYQVEIIWTNLLLAALILAIGVFIIQLIIGIITFFSFWLGRIESVRNLFMSILEVKQYPMNLFPVKLQKGLTYLIPVFFIAYYPCLLLLGKAVLDIKLVGLEIGFLIVVSLLFKMIWNLGLKKYEANGG